MSHWMKAKSTLFILLMLSLISVEATANQEAISADFLEFLADMEEVTGDGFEDWLETDNEYDQYESNNEYNTRSMENQ